MSTLNRLVSALVLLVVIGGVGGGMGRFVAQQQVTACTQLVEACQ